MFIKLRDVRQQKGLSIRELEKLSGVDRSVISRIENEDSNPRLRTMCKIARALRVTLDNIVEYTEECINEEGDFI